MIREHADAVGALLVANPNLFVFGKPVTNETKPPYVRWFLSLDLEDAEGLCGTSDMAHWRVTTHSVGSDDLMAYIVSGQVRSSLIDVAPTVNGWSASRIRHEAGVTPQRDTSTGSEVLDAIDVWTFTSTPA